MQAMVFPILKYPLIIFAAGLLSVGCRAQKNKAGRIKVISKKTLDSIPSGSALLLAGDTAFIMGDDATGLYALNVKDHNYRKIPITGIDQQAYREPKIVKHDLEASILLPWKGSSYLLGFGSGSNSSSRDSLLIMNAADHRKQHIISLRTFYRWLQASTGSKETEWNIEGATIVDSSLILLNRGNNLVIQMPMNEFMAFVASEHSPFPTIEFFKARLPLIGSHEARFSGACTLDKAFLLFAASVEDTPDWTQDGPILGSIIGLYSLIEKRVVASWVLKDRKGITLKEKIESIDIISAKASGLVRLLAIGDNDDGTSTLWELEIKLPGGVDILK